jgi:chloramphenicol 3-O-phosphotransferase
MSSLIFLYGPPAAGKFSVATALSKTLGYPLFHNHTVIDYVETLLTREDAQFLAACEEVRNALTARALSSGKSFITTFVYGAGVDDDFVSRMRAIVANAGARFCPVQLTCSIETLRERCVAPHRVVMGKISTPQKLNAMIDEYECFRAIPEVASLTIDTDQSSIDESVAQIRAHFHI